MMPFHKNNYFIAAAGAGKTSTLVHYCLDNPDKSILFTTYTDYNANNIKSYFIHEVGYVPSNVTIQPWFTFLFRHGINPFLGKVTDLEIKGITLVNGRSALYVPETNFKLHYLNEDNRVYTDKLAKLVIKCNRASKGAVIDRLEKIFKVFCIDEVQDLAGEDFDVLVMLFNSTSEVLLVGDPRQTTYTTSESSKYKQFKNGLLHEFITKNKNSIDVNIDTDKLKFNMRCIEEICLFSNRLFPELPECHSINPNKTDHDGMFLVDAGLEQDYCKMYIPMQLRWDINRQVVQNYPVLNMGQSKGNTYSRVLIYPTEPMLKWIKDNSFLLSPKARSKFYVSVTRAESSVGIVVPKNFPEIEVVQKWK